MTFSSDNYEPFETTDLTPLLAAMDEAAQALAEAHQKTTSTEAAATAEDVEAGPGAGEAVASCPASPRPGAQTPSEGYPAAPPAGSEERTLGGGGSCTSPHGSPRPAVVPDAVSVTLPVVRVALATTTRGETFQPDSVKWEAFTHDTRVIVTVWARRVMQTQSQMIDVAPGGEPVPGWVPEPPEWFQAELARMRASVTTRGGARCAS